MEKKRNIFSIFFSPNLSSDRLSALRSRIRLSFVSFREHKHPTHSLFAFRLFLHAVEERETLERWLIDARVLPLASLPAWKDLGWDRKDKTPSQPPKTPVLK